MSVNLSKEKREKLISKINEIKKFIQSSKQDENTNNLLSYIAELEKDVKDKKYGLVFEEHKEQIDEILEDNVPVLTEDNDLFIDNGGQMNFLIEGDNLASLQLLEKTHKGKIDLIYIDPPYNTGNKDFIYDDRYIESSDTFSHSKWLSLMKERIKLGYALLSPKGAIFISIDEHEFAQLKMLCDDVIGSENFVDCVSWDKKSSAKGVPPVNMLVNVHEYILVYSKSAFKFIGQKRDEGGFSNPDNDPRGLWRNTNIKSTIKSKDKSFAIINPETGISYTDTWAFSPKELQRLIDEKYLIFPKKGNGQVRRKEFLNELKNVNQAIKSSWGLFDNQQNTEMLKALLPNVVFLNPKPLNLLTYLISVSVSNKNSIILDFFAGSGTTGHAVMKLNAEDNGNRKFILCTNNENNICKDVTYERIKRVVEKENYKASMKYMKVDFVPIKDKLYYEYADDLLKHIKELVELENAVNFKDNKNIAIILTDDELDKFTKELPNECKTIYLGNDVLPTQDQELLFRKKNIKINTIPDYYYKELEG